VTTTNVSSTLPIALTLITATQVALSSELEEVLVTASRQSASAFELPYTLNTLTHDQLAQQQSRNLPEALAGIPGVMVQKTANGQGSPFIRGFTGYRTLALIDGVRYNNSVYRDGPNEYFSLIDSLSLQQIELLSGPASGLYGSDAIGGALNLKSKAPRHQQQIHNDFYQLASISYRSASAEHSDIARAEYEVGLGQEWGLRLGYSHKDFGDVRGADNGSESIGEQPFTGYDEQAFDIRFDRQLNDQWDISLLHQQLEQDDVWRTHSTIYAVSFAGSVVGGNLRRLKDQQRQLTRLKLKGQPLNDWIDSAEITLSEQQWQEDGDRIKDNGEHILQGFDSTMRGIDIALSSQTQDTDWRFGADYYRDKVDSWRNDYNSDGSLDEVRIQGPIGDDSTYTQWGLYLQADWQVAEDHQLLWSSRYGQTQADIGRYEDPNTGLAASFSDNWSSLVNALRYTYNLSNNHADSNLWAGISQSFRAPNVGDLSRYGKSRSDETEVAATDLDPEKFLTYELGIKWRQGNTLLEASYYYTETEDFIASVPTGRVVGGLTEVRKKNAATGYIEGVELRAEQQLSPQWRLRGNATWLVGELDDSEGERENYSRLMPPTLNLQLVWQPTDYDAEVSLHYSHANKADKLSSGDENDLERIPPGGTPAYNLWHLRGHIQLTPNLLLNLAIDNLFDEAYRVHGSGSNEPGRNLKAGFRYEF
jgi:outer membrane receptor protein involved in Fe transport